ncbi:hypothetical protein BVC80_8777g17 [Macleaya cordata]|uniref:Uncharacterized protein n=1 Tax=Macleaya cordata TaxID=56857 RepID=A0A200QSI5_MACCD|nr:hypothetical protein BVC80_8777g17 [Macleaya cordata]
MSDPYERAKTGRLTFKGGSLATLKSIDKKKHKKKKTNKSTIQNSSEEPQPSDEAIAGASVVETNGGETIGDIYTIDAAKRMKYDELFPVEAKKFGYEPKSVSKSVEDALDDRVKKKADRYCK